MGSRLGLAGIAAGAMVGAAQRRLALWAHGDKDHIRGRPSRLTRNRSLTTSAAKVLTGADKAPCTSTAVSDRGARLCGSRYVSVSGPAEMI